MLLLPTKFVSLNNHHVLHHHYHPRNPNPNPLLRRRRQTLKVFSGKRSGRQRYPSERKVLKLKHKENVESVINRHQGIWRLSKLAVPVDLDPGKDFLGVSDSLLHEIAKVLEFPVASMLPPEAFTVVRKSFDARKRLKEPKFVYIVEMDVDKLLRLEPRAWDFISELEPKVGLVEHLPEAKKTGDLTSIIRGLREVDHQGSGSGGDGGTRSNGLGGLLYKVGTAGKPKIAVVGSGPSGLFAALVLAEFGADVTLIERGQPVEQRGRDIGALAVRRILQMESNFCFGEGGAGTWSDGKLVTRIGRNSGSVLAVMKTLVQLGAPEGILVDGKPHLGTDKLVPLLRNFRQHLLKLGVTIKFGTRVDDLLVDNDRVVGVEVSDSVDRLQSSSKKLEYDAVVLAVGHSARDLYQTLVSHDVELIPKDFAVGLRIEHPQEVINSLQYSGLAPEIHRGRGKVPVADYKVAKYVSGENGDEALQSTSRSCYSFCMCPGGQVVLTSTSPSEICVNGMSFSRRASKWANAALVVTVSMKDFAKVNLQGPLAGVQFQREFEQRAARMGGGNFVVPVQTVTDFMDNKLSGTSVPKSSYRLGVKAANLHKLFPDYVTETLQLSLSAFDKELPGFISKEALLHGVETRTSSPIQIPRSVETYESTSLRGLYPVGEGAGYAGGIVSAAVDGMHAGFAVAKNFGLCNDGIESILGKARSAGFVEY